MTRRPWVPPTCPSNLRVIAALLRASLGRDHPEMEGIITSALHPPLPAAAHTSPPHCNVLGIAGHVQRAPAVHPRALPSRTSTQAAPVPSPAQVLLDASSAAARSSSADATDGMGATTRGWPLVHRVRSVWARSTRPVRERGGLATSIQCAGALQGPGRACVLERLGRSRRDRVVELRCPGHRGSTGEVL